MELFGLYDWPVYIAFILTAGVYIFVGRGAFVNILIGVVAIVGYLVGSLIGWHLTFRTSQDADFSNIISNFSGLSLGVICLYIGLRLQD